MPAPTDRYTGNLGPLLLVRAPVGIRGVEKTEGLSWWFPNLSTYVYLAFRVFLSLQFLPPYEFSSWY